MTETCPTCAVTYRPSLTRDECPVCGTASSVQRPRRRWADPHERVLGIVVLATLGNLVLLALLAVLALTA